MYLIVDLEFNCQMSVVVNVIKGNRVLAHVTNAACLDQCQFTEPWEAPC